MPFEIVRNDITKMETDAIVNTANPRPVIGAGTDYAIHAAAGPKLLEARKKIGDIAVGASVATPAFRLHARYVLHTVSPVWVDGEHNEEELLQKAYESALALALKLRCRSVAFPLMAAGSYGFPRDKALLIAMRAISEFSLRHRMQIYLVVFNAEATSAAGDLFADLKSYIDDRYVDERNEEEYHFDRPYGRRWREIEELREYQLNFRPRPAKKPSRAESDGMQSVVASTAASSPDADLGEFLKWSESTFTEHLISLLNECGEKDPIVYHRAGLSRQLFNKIINNKNYQPKKETAIQLAIGLKLDMAQTQALLAKAGYALTRSSRFDLVIQYYIERKSYNVVLINNALYDCGLPLLKVS